MKIHSTEIDIAKATLASKGIIEPNNAQLASDCMRNNRNLLLKETDWWCCSDRTPTQAQLDYRQALRDLPANSTPSLDENGQLTGVEWPTKPE